MSRWITLTLVLTLAAPFAAAQEEKKPGDPPRRPGGFGGPGGPGGRGGFAPPLSERSVAAAAERYKLSDEQKAAFEKLIADRKEGAEKIGAEMRKIFEKVREAREAGQEVDREAVRKDMQPLMEQASKYRGETLDKFAADILDEQQRRQFEEDRKAGRDPFSGRGGPGGPGGPGGRGGRGGAFGGGFSAETVKAAAAKYGLNDEQKAAADKLVEDRKGEAEKISGEIRKMIEGARSGGQVDREALREKMQPLMEQQRKHRDESVDMFRAILTDEQKAKFDEDKKAGRDPFQARGPGGPPRRRQE
jgi:Spy/CpxP family protein refolding chaperone